MPHLHLHLVSDSTGETLISTARAVMAQFEDVSATEHVCAFVRSRRQLDEVMGAVRKTHGIILFTLVDKDVREELQRRCDTENITCISVLGPVISAVGSYLGLEGRGEPGRQHMVNAEYFRRIAAMNFAIAHDDGHMTKDSPNADMILVGVSRTSKTPTCAYLANRGYKAANIPIVAGMSIPEEIYEFTKPLIVGLTINPQESSPDAAGPERVRLYRSRCDQAGADLCTAPVQPARLAGDRRDAPFDRRNRRRDPQSLQPTDRGDRREQPGIQIGSSVSINTWMAWLEQDAQVFKILVQSTFDKQIFRY